MLNHRGTGTHQVRDPGMGNATSLAADGGAHCAARTETEDLGARGASGREKGGSSGTGSCSTMCSIPRGCCCCKQSLPKDTGGCAERVGPTDPDWSKRTALCAEGK